MKKLFTLTAILLCNIMLFAQGINFQNLTYKEALEKAKTENKLVFIDCYTTWCGPCQTMAKNIFPQEKVGDYFNPRFISVKYDMEKGEGVELAKQFGLQAYPTFLIINPDGTLRHRLVGDTKPMNSSNWSKKLLSTQKLWAHWLANLMQVTVIRISW